MLIAFDAGGNEIAVGIGTSASARDNMVEAARAAGELDQAIETLAELAGMNGFAPGWPLQEIDPLEIDKASGDARATGQASANGWSSDANFTRQTDLDDMAGSRSTLE